jgi:hypothetical protein
MYITQGLQICSTSLPIGILFEKKVLHLSSQKKRLEEKNPTMQESLPQTETDLDRFKLGSKEAPRRHASNGGRFIAMRCLIRYLWPFKFFSLGKNR